ARKIFDRLKPLIEGAQTNLPEGPAPVPVQPTSQAREQANSVPLKTFRPDAHWTLFTVLLLNVLFDLSRFYTLDLTLYLVGLVFGVGMIFPLIFALVRQSNSDAPGFLRK